MKKDNKNKDSTPLIEGVDFYLEAGKYVFTEKFLIARGYCCGSGCRHCPYEKAESRKIED